MLANSYGRIALVAGLCLSSTLAWGQFTPSGQQAEADAYRTLNNYMYQATQAGRAQPFAVAQTAFSQTPTPANTPTPAFVTPSLNFGVAASPGLGGNAGAPATTYTPAPIGGVANSAAAGAGVDGLVPFVPGTGAGEVPTFVYGQPEDGCCGEFPFRIGGNPLACGCDDCCRCCGKFCFGAEYLGWWTRGMRVPELLTCSPVGTDPSEAGVRGWPSTEVHFGGGRMDSDVVSGGRFRGSLALDCNGCNRIDFEYLFLGDNDFGFSLDSPTDHDILARPYYNRWSGAEDSEFVGYPGLVEGRVDISGETSFDGWGVWWRHNLLCCGGGGCGCGDCGGVGGGLLGGFGGAACGGGPLAGYGCCPPRKRFMPCRADLLLGYRRLDLDEQVTIRESLTSVDPLGAVPYGTTFDIVDQFETDNQFDGFDVGLNWDWCCGKFGVNVLTKVAFGRNRRRASIRGWTDITEPGIPTDYYEGGLLALPSNIGLHEQDDFAVIPEVGLTAYYQLSCKLRLNFGYSLISFSDVFRPGDMIDLNVDPRQIPPPTVADGTRPWFQDWHDNFWAQGLNVGLEYCF